MQAGRGLDRMRDTELRDDLGVRGFDVFCPASFLNVMPWIASLDLFARVGLDAVAEHDQRLVERLLAGLDPEHHRLVSPRKARARSTLVVLSDTRIGTVDLHHRLAGAGIDAAHREGNLRLSVHLFTTAADIDRTLDALT
jgi:selenocysteine lyase/cysteine desulfurase